MPSSSSATPVTGFPFASPGSTSGVVKFEPLPPSLAPNRDGHRIYTVPYRVHCLSERDGPGVVFAAISAATFIGQTYAWGNDADPKAVLDPVPQIQLENPSIRTVYLCTFTYTTEGRDKCRTSNVTDPLAEPWTSDGDADEYSELMDKDLDGKPVQSSSHEPFTGKQAERIRTRRRLQLSKNFATLNLDWIDSLEGTTNQNAITLLGKSFAAKTLVIRKIRHQTKVQMPCKYYFPHTFCLDVNPETFVRKLIDRGRRKLSAGGDVANPQHFEPIRLSDGTPVKDPVLLDGAGNVKATGASPVVLEFKFHEEADWSSIGFPSTALS